MFDIARNWKVPGKFIKITITEIDPEEKSHKRQWKMFGTANTGQTLDGINLRDLAYD